MLQMLKFMRGTLEDDRQDRQRETGHEIPGSIDRGNLRAKAAGKTVHLRMMRRIRQNDLCFVQERLRAAGRQPSMTAQTVSTEA
jgi:hypothetical protein